MAKKNALAKRKKPTPHKGQFTKERLPPTVFQPGVSGNPSGTSKAREDRLFSRAVGEQAGYRAPDADAEAVGLGRGASNAQVAAGRAWQMARNGDIAAQRLVHEVVEGKGPSTAIGIAINGGDPRYALPPGFELPQGSTLADVINSPRMSLLFVESDGNGNISEKSLKEMADIGKHHERQGYQAIHCVGVTRYVLKDAGSPEGDDGPVIQGEMLGPE